MKASRKIGSGSPPSTADLRALDRQTIDTSNNEQVARIANLCRTTTGRVLHAANAVGPRVGNIRKYLQENPRKPIRRFRRRER